MAWGAAGGTSLGEVGRQGAPMGRVRMRGTQRAERGGTAAGLGWAGARPGAMWPRTRKGGRAPVRLASATLL